MAHSAKFTESEPIWFCSLFYRVLHSVKYVHRIFFVCFSAYPVTISNKITENYNNMTDRQYISHICPQMSHPLTITNICRQAPCKVHKHHQHMSKVQPSPTKSTVQHTKLSNKVGWPVTWSEACGETESSPGLDHPAYRCSIQL